jgi:hypothetical protein
MRIYTEDEGDDHSLWTLGYNIIYTDLPLNLENITTSKEMALMKNRLFPYSWGVSEH